MQPACKVDIQTYLVGYQHFDAAEKKRKVKISTFHLIFLGRQACTLGHITFQKSVQNLAPQDSKLCFGSKETENVEKFDFKQKPSTRKEETDFGLSV